MEHVVPYDEAPHNFSKRHLVDIVSNRDLLIYETVNFFVISSFISSFGVFSNMVNIVVFYKQGFDNTMNISFFALAISDLCSLILILWFNISLSGLLAQAGLPVSSMEITYLGGGHPHICFARITSWITVYITAERCLCIMFPLKIKQLITPRRTALILCAIYILIMLSFEPEYQTAYIGWRFDERENQTLLGLMFTSDRKDLEGVTFILYSILGFASFIIVIIFTFVLVIQLNKKSIWRKTANIPNSRSESVSNKERKTIKMVVIIAIVLIVCYTPGVAVSSVSFFELEFSVMGQYKNGFLAMWSFVFVFEAVNSSVNIFLYYYMSTKYRVTFRLLVGFRSPVVD